MSVNCLERGNAVQLLREVLSLLETSVTVSSVCLIPSNSRIQDKCRAEYQIRIGARLDNSTRKTLKQMLEKRDLVMEETDDSILISKLDQKP
jgi:hypothetical protein